MKDQINAENRSLVSVESLSKSFMRLKNSFFAVKDVSFSVQKGEYIHIVGKSGSGKTTLLHMIAGLLIPNSGAIYFDNQNILIFNDFQKSQYRNKSIGFIPQSVAMLPNLSVLDNVRLPHFFFNADGDGIDRALLLLEMLEIKHLKDDFPQNLSGGEIKRMFIARALMNDPQLLIADEPTADLDPITARMIMQIFTKINDLGTSIVMVTHQIDLLGQNSKIFTMQDGCLLEGCHL